MAIEEESDPEDYIDKEINRKIALKRTETVKSVVHATINENDDILFRIKRRQKAEQDAMKKMKVNKENVYIEKFVEDDANANLPASKTGKRGNDLYETVIEEFKKSPKMQRKTGNDNLNEDEASENAAIVIQAMFKGYKIRKELDEIKAFHRNMSQPVDDDRSQSISESNKVTIKGGQRRQDSYLAAVCSPPDSFADDGPGTKRPWKARQESYAEAVNTQPREAKTADWQKRQNSYQAAVDGGAGLDLISASSIDAGRRPTRQVKISQQKCSHFDSLICVGLL